MQLIGYFLEHNRYLNLVGIAIILGIAWLCSRNRSKINYRLVVRALLLHFGAAFIMLKVKFGQMVVGGIADIVFQLYESADAGISFVFGSLNNMNGPW